MCVSVYVYAQYVGACECVFVLLCVYTSCMCLCAIMYVRVYVCIEQEEVRTSSWDKWSQDLPCVSVKDEDITYLALA